MGRIVSTEDNAYLHRKGNRLKDFDYGTECAYFITLCTNNRRRLFQLENGSCVLSNEIIHKWIKETENKFENCVIDRYVIMPDHLHFIVIIEGTTLKARSLQDILKFFKTMTTNEYMRCVKEGKLLPFDKKLWQKSYYDHIIRCEQDYIETCKYIEQNPQEWAYEHK